MAVVSTIKCQKCGEDKQIWHSVQEFPKVCNECKQKETDNLSLEERIRNLEKRLEMIEYKNMPIG